MANLKNIADLPVAESAEGLNLIVNDNGAAKQIAASAVGAQADWAETDENSPAFVKNKPVEEYDLDVNITVFWDAENSEFAHSYTANSGNFESCKNKIMNGIQPKLKIVWYEQGGGSADALSSYGIPDNSIFIIPAEAMGEGSPEMVMFDLLGMNHGVVLALLSDNSVMDMNIILGGE